MSTNIVFYDIETTGLDKGKDYIIQFAAIKVDRDTNSIIDSMNIYIQPSGPYSITVPAYSKHGIKPDMLSDKSYFSDVANDILAFFEGCDLATYNGNSFDASFLRIEMNRAGIDFDPLEYNNYDVFYEEKRRNGNNLDCTFKRYVGKSMEEFGLTAHDALSDVKATWEVFKRQQEKQTYGPEEILSDDNFICDGIFMNKPYICFGYGKYREYPVLLVYQLDPSYIEWCLSDKCNTSKRTKETIKSIIEAEKS